MATILYPGYDLYLLGGMKPDLSTIPLVIADGSDTLVKNFSDTLSATTYTAKLYYKKAENDGHNGTRFVRTLVNNLLDGTTTFTNELAEDAKIWIAPMDPAIPDIPTGPDPRPPSHIITNAGSVGAIGAKMELEIKYMDASSQTQTEEVTVSTFPCYNVTDFSFVDTGKNEDAKYIGDVRELTLSFSYLEESLNAERAITGALSVFSLFTYLDRYPLEQVKTGKNQVKIGLTRANRGNSLYDITASFSIGNNGKYNGKTTLHVQYDTIENLGVEYKAQLNGGKWVVYNNGVYMLINKYTGSKYYLVDENNIVRGFLENVGDKELKGNMILFDLWTPSVYGQSNITITFPNEVDGNADKINKCTFGKLFGASNARNRLFVSGNSTLPNYDWHSSDSDVQGDYTYFPDDSYCRYGTDDSGLVGYGIVSDGKLLAVKSPSDKEGSVYYRTGALTAIQASDGSTLQIGGQAIYKESFPLIVTNSKTGGVSFNLFCDFNGESLYVSNKKDIVGLDLTGNVYDTQRVATTRSYPIDLEIKNVDTVSDNCRLFDDGDVLYYATPDYLYSTYADLKWEWFKTNIKGIRAHAHRTDEGFETNVFGDSEGNVIFFTGDYSDHKRLYVQSGGYTINGNEITFSGKYDEYAKDSEGIGFETLSISQDYSDRQYAPVLFDKNATYRITGITDADGSVTSISNILFGKFFLNEDGIYEFKNSEMALDPERQQAIIEFDKKINASAKISFQANASNIELENNTYHYDEEKKKVIIDIVDSTMAIKKQTIAFIEQEFPVVSYYITSPFTAGHLGMNKTIWSYTFLADKGDINSISIARTSNENVLDTIVFPESVISTKGFSFEKYDYDYFTFENHKLPYTYTAYRPMTVGFLCLVVGSDKPVVSYLTGLQFTYSIPSKTYGKN